MLVKVPLQQTLSYLYLVVQNYLVQSNGFQGIKRGVYNNPENFEIVFGHFLPQKIYETLEIKQKFFSNNSCTSSIQNQKSVQTLVI